MKSFAWSSGAQIIDYTVQLGKGGPVRKLQGSLYLPANYEKGKTYPTLVYIYEKLTNGHFGFTTPSANGFNKSVYTSNGYAVLMPDITYKVNDPGMSAVWCLTAAVKAAIATGVVDPKRIGLQGHSWGGYQTAFTVTQTDLFAAAIAGAPLTNMVSMYSLIYKNSGGGNMSIFESSQGRFLGGYWDNWDAYYRNSPVNFAKNVKTPLVILHNDKDGAVDFTQGVEYYNTLRRLGKPVVMLEYPGENHNLAKAPNQQDYTVRMKEFFDHHLMGKPAPDWWAKGVSRLEMEDYMKARLEEQRKKMTPAKADGEVARVSDPRPKPNGPTGASPPAGSGAAPSLPVPMARRQKTALITGASAGIGAVARARVRRERLRPRADRAPRRPARGPGAGDRQGARPHGPRHRGGPGRPGCALAPLRRADARRRHASTRSSTTPATACLAACSTRRGTSTATSSRSW